jgi:hypothetical protein
MPKSFDKKECSIDSSQYDNFVAKINEKYPNDKSKSLRYAQEIMPGQFFIYYLCERLQTDTMDCIFPLNGKPAKEEMIFTTEAIEMLLIAISYMSKHMQMDLPEKTYHSILLKGNLFFNQLMKQVEDYSS